MTKESGFVIINHVVKTTQKFIAFEPLAQAAEHLPFKQGVPGSIPGWLTKILFYTFKDTAIGVLETVNKIIYHTAKQLHLLHCDNIQFDTVALLLLTLTHPKRITAIQLRSVSALSSLADIQQIQTILYPIPENRLSSQSLVITKLAIQFVLPLGKAAGGDIHCGFTPCISDLKTQEPPASGKLLKALAKLY